MYEQEIQLQVKNFRKGATYREVKEQLIETYGEIESLPIITGAYNRYMRRKANRFIIYGIITTVALYLYHFLYEPLTMFDLLKYNFLSSLILVSGLYLKFRYRTK